MQHYRDMDVENANIFFPRTTLIKLYVATCPFVAEAVVFVLI